MINVYKGIIILSLSVSLCNAENNQSTQNEFIYIDKLHKSISETIIEWSEIIDTTLSNWLEDNETYRSNVETNITGIERNNTEVEGNTTIIETNTTAIETNTTIIETRTSSVPSRTRTVKRNTTIIPNSTTAVGIDVPENTVEEKVRSVDSFFQNEKYLNETDNTFIRVRSESYLQSKGSNDFGLNVRAQMPFSKTRKRFKIFVDDLTLDNANDILKDTSESPDIGIHYFASRHKIKSRYSIGLSGIDPFVRARYSMPTEIDQWLIDPVQLFRYSMDKKFEEETNIYFDRKVNKNSLLRVQLHRKTQDEIDGMDYALSVQYFRSTKKDTGFGFTQSFYGNTEYEYTTDKGVPNPKIKRYGGIYDYVSTVTWRANIWRKWFYYEVRPAVSFHKQYDYEPNYSIRVFFDFYFGEDH